MLDALMQAALPAREDSPVIVMVSGGSDSTALLVLAATGELDLRDGRGPRRIDPARLVTLHVNHCIRGEESDGDEGFVRGLCARLGVACEVRRVDVPALVRRASRGRDAAEGEDPARRPPANLEEVAREQRYRLAWEVARRRCAALGQPVGCARVLVAHTADDRAETFVMRAMTGAGLAGLTGMRPVRGIVVRPLLGMTREGLREGLRTRGIGWREDATNDRDDALRSYVRHHVTAAMRERVPSFAVTLGRSLDQLEQDSDLLDRLADALLARALRPSLPPDAAYASGAGLPRPGEPRVVRLDAARIAEAEPALARRALLVALRLALGDEGARRARPESRHVLEMLDLASRGAGRATLPLGTDVSCEGGVLTIAPAPALGAPPSGGALPRADALGGGARGDGARLASPGAASDGEPPLPGPDTAVLRVPGELPWHGALIVSDLVRVPVGADARAFAREVAAHTASELDLARARGAARPSMLPAREGGDFVLLDARAAGIDAGACERGQLPPGAEPRPGTYLEVSGACEGDRMCPLGMGGHTKLVSDVLMEARVPAARRREVPVVRVAPDAPSWGETARRERGAAVAPTSGEGVDLGRCASMRVVWVGGIRPAQTAAYSRDSRVLLRLRIVSMGTQPDCAVPFSACDGRDGPQGADGD
ncbi:MAG: tRNA lysidine(34) synthetase TilS [Coriobacteriales bacterium]